jgi:5'-nucleotidase
MGALTPHPSSYFYLFPFAFNSMLKVLVSNDDGIDSAGIVALAAALREIAHVWVVAPDTQQSAVGHALTISVPLRVDEHVRDGKPFGWKVNGKPADCVKLAVQRLLPERPDVVVSGINHGRNTAVSLIYSGTVSGATEGSVLGIPSVAFSLDDVDPHADFTFAAKFAAWLVPIVAERGLPRGVLLNVNIPKGPESGIKGVRIAEQGESFWDDTYEERHDPMGRPYYWLTGSYSKSGAETSDDHALDDGYVAVTPIHYRLTDAEMMEQIRTWELEKWSAG